jgi:alkylation response protein AidB-like acyl-CoA dehydrogenase
MDLSYGADLDGFRREVRGWLDANLTGAFAQLRGRGGPGDEHTLVDERRAWERHLGGEGWIGIGWPKEFGGRGLGLWHEVIWAEEYARARGPGRLGHMGEQLAGPTLMAFGTEEQQHRFLPRVLDGTELWCQGYSEPDAGSDLANVATRAELVGDEWVIDGQKVWTSLAHLADWCFVLARTDRESQRHRGLSFLLVPMRQPGVEIRPINQLTGDSEFNETFFSGARTAADNVVGQPGEGWRAAMALLGFERGVSTLGQQLGFDAELAAVLEVARRRGVAGDPVLRQRMAAMWGRLRIMRLTSLRALSADARGGGTASPAGVIGKLYWATLHRDLGELAFDVMGMEATVGGLLDDDVVGRLRRVFLFSRADTIYGGSNQIQRNIIGERTLGLSR